MQLPTANHRSAAYPDRLSDGVTWIEYVSQANVLGHEVLAEEVESLAAAGLLVQHELGVPVVKLLNITNLIYATDGHPREAREADPDLNFVGLLVSDGERYGAEATLKGGLSRASAATQEHFADVPDSLSRILRFIDAVGADTNNYAVHAPWIHLTIDRPRGVGDEGGRLAVAERWPWLSSQALWWLDDLDEESLLFRVDSSQRVTVDVERPGVYVPLPVTRGPLPTEGSTERTPIRSTAGNRPVVGFRLVPTGSANDSTLIDVIWEYIDHYAS
jgi:hypothetical protein